MRFIGLELILASAVLLCGSTCSLPWARSRREEISIVAYNVHNLFDDVDAGTEYPEFRLGSSSWNSELYRKRLELTAYALKSLYPEHEDGPDLLCLSEVESPKVIRDLAEGPLKDDGYRWAFVGGPPSSPIRCALLSRLPILSAKAHALSVDSAGTRDMLEVSVGLEPEKEGGGRRLELLLCHWKSRLEGAEATEGLRRSAAALAVSRLSALFSEDEDALVLVCGDFNESPDEFERAGKAYATAFMPSRAAEGGDVPAAWMEGALMVADSRGDASTRPGEIALFSPWKEKGGWSYVFKGDEERLDGILISRGLVDGADWEFVDFAVGDDPELLDDDGTPFAWNGTAGFSDHLPIAVRLGRSDR